MAPEYISFGEAYPDCNPERLTQVAAKRTISVCLAHKDFEVLELRCLRRSDVDVSDIIIVDCVNDQVPSRNPLGIKVRERLALVFRSDSAPEVRALRKDFTTNVLHLNHVGPGQPAWFCLYFESWGIVERTWTPQKFLQRILWWLSETAKGTLHRADQPLERLYFDTPFEIVLPPDFESKIKNTALSLTYGIVKRSSGDFNVLRGFFVPEKQAQGQEVPQTEVLSLELPAVVHGGVEFYPNTLGQLHDQFELRGVRFLAELTAFIREKASLHGLVRNPLGRCLLILRIPVKRSAEVAPEAHEIRAFLLPCDLAALGEAMGVLTPHEGKLYATQIIGSSSSAEVSLWRFLEILPVEVKFEADKAFARKTSGVSEGTADFKGVLSGVGALGSAMAELWVKESWGEWSLIDSDIVKAHNVIRHLAKNPQIGQFKVDAVKAVVEANYHDSYCSVVAIPDSIINAENRVVKEALTSAALLVDATTTLEVPRELAQRDDVPRSVSVFVTPSGGSSVLLFEAADRSIRLDSLEAQYYRAIINSDWGENHLNGHNGMLAVGAGCRDVSLVMSNEIIQLHAATLARQVRILRDKPEPRMRIWTGDIETGALAAHEVPVYAMLQTISGEWRVFWDADIQQKLCTIRLSHLPSETGGVVLGYIDQKLKSIYVVDVLSAPPDSEADRTGFTRGVEGLAANLNEVTRRTANIVRYIGEWHSHPAFASAYPSSLDRALIEKLSNTLSLDGEPALMIIVGSAGDSSITVKEG